MAMKKTYRFLLGLFIAISCSVCSGYTVEVISDPGRLSDSLVGRGLSIVPTGTTFGNVAQVGMFDNLISEHIPFTNGIIISTGQITSGAGVLTNTTCVKDYGHEVETFDTWTTDPDLAAATPELGGTVLDRMNALYDAAGIVLYVTPSNKTINIPFAFASEEFFYQGSRPYLYNRPSLADYRYSDAFAFFVSEGVLEPYFYTYTEGSGSMAYEKTETWMEYDMTNNISVLPSGEAIQVMNVNQYTNQQFFVANVITNNEGQLLFPGDSEYPDGAKSPLPMEFNGAIVRPVCVITNLVPGQPYTIKVVVADCVDRWCNSAVFLQDHGITSGADLKIDVSGPATMSAPGEVTFTNIVSNIGPAPADGVVVTNYLPVGVEKNTVTFSDPSAVDPSSWGSIGETNYFVWTIGDSFAPGSNAVLRINCTLPDFAIYTNLATVVTSTGDYDESNNRDQCVTVVGSTLPKLVIQAVTREKRFGDELNLSDLQFVASVTNEYGHSYAIGEIATGIEVTFTNKATAAEAFPTNDVTGVGEYYICLSNVTLKNPGEFGEVIYERGLLTVTQRCVTVTAPSMELEPEDALPTEADLFQALTNNWGTLVVGTIPSESAPDVGVIRADSLMLENPGDKVNQAITASGAADQGNYKVAYLPGQLTVKPKVPLDVYIGETNVVYLAPVPTFTWDNIVTEVAVTDPGKNWKDYVTGWDQPGLIVTSYTASESDGVGGTYWISTNRVGTVKLSSERYAITVHDGVLRVEPRQIAPTKPGEEPPDVPNPLLPWAAAYPVEKCYDGDGTNITYASGNIYGTVDYKFAYAVNQPAMDSPLWSDYDNIFTNVMFDADGHVRATNVWCRVTAGDNYIGTVVSNTVTVTQRCVTVTAPSMVLEPEETLPTEPDLFLALTNNWGTLVVGTIPSESAPDAGVIRADSLTLENPGEKVSQAILSEGKESQGNYKVTYLPGLLTVGEKIPLDVYIGETNVVYLAPVPTFTWDNIVTNVTVTDPGKNWKDYVTGWDQPGLIVTSYTASESDGVGGTYWISTNRTGTVKLSSERYAITVHDGVLRVAPRQIAPTKPGEEPPDVPNPLLPWAAAYPVVKCYDGDGTNITYASGNIYGTVDYKFAYAVDRPAMDSPLWSDYDNIFTNVMFDADGHVRATNVWCRVTAGDNYIGTVVSNTVTVTQRCVTVTATSTGKAWSLVPVPDPVLEYTTAPDPWFAVAADESLLVGELERAAGEDIGEYAITQKVVFAAGTNYRFDFVPGTFTIDGRIPLDVYIGATNVVYGDSVPAFTWDNIVTNTVAANGEEIRWSEVPKSSFAFTTTYTPTSDVGTYPITTNGATLASGRYAITVHDGELTVRPAEICPFVPTPDKPEPIAGDPEYGEPWAAAYPVVKCYDGDGTNIAYASGNILPGNAVEYKFAYTAAKPAMDAAVWTEYDNRFVDVVDATNVWCRVTAGDNYIGTIVGATVTITQRCVTVTAPSVTRLIGETNPTDGELTDGCTMDGKIDDGFALVYSATCTYAGDEVGTHEDVITVAGEESQGNYLVSYVAGDLTIKPLGSADLRTSMTAKLNWDTGLLDLELTVRNVGTAAVDPDAGYRAELVPGPAAGDVAKTYYLVSPTGTTQDGADTVDLAAAVRSALRSVGNRDEVFDPGEAVTLTGVSVYHWQRWSPEKFIDVEHFVKVEDPVGQEEPVSHDGVTSLSASRAAAARSLRSTGGADVPAEVTAATVYDGVLYGGEVLAGSIRVKLAKASKKTGLSKLTATLAPVGGKKITVRGNFDPGASSFSATAKDGRKLELVIGKNGFSGTFGEFRIDGARNRYSSKADEDKTVVETANKWIGKHSLEVPSADGWTTYVVKVAKKGKVKVTGKPAGSRKVSVTAQMIIGNERCFIPVLYAKKDVSLAFGIWLGEDGVEVVGLDGAVWNSFSEHK